MQVVLDFLRCSRSLFTGFVIDYLKNSCWLRKKLSQCDSFCTVFSLYFSYLRKTMNFDFKPAVLPLCQYKKLQEDINFL